MAEFKTDIEIARAADKKPIQDIEGINRAEVVADRSAYLMSVIP